MADAINKLVNTPWGVLKVQPRMFLVDVWFACNRVKKRILELQAHYEYKGCQTILQLPFITMTRKQREVETLLGFGALPIFHLANYTDRDRTTEAFCVSQPMLEQMVSRTCQILRVSEGYVDGGLIKTLVCDGKIIDWFRKGTGDHRPFSTCAIVLDKRQMLVVLAVCCFLRQENTLILTNTPREQRAMIATIKTLLKEFSGLHEERFCVKPAERYRYNSPSKQCIVCTHKDIMMLSEALGSFTCAYMFDPYGNESILASVDALSVQVDIVCVTVNFTEEFKQKFIQTVERGSRRSYINSYDMWASQRSKDPRSQANSAIIHHDEEHLLFHRIYLPSTTRCLDDITVICEDEPTFIKRIFREQKKALIVVPPSDRDYYMLSLPPFVRQYAQLLTTLEEMAEDTQFYILPLNLLIVCIEQQMFREGEEFDVRVRFLSHSYEIATILSCCFYPGNCYDTAKRSWTPPVLSFHPAPLCPCIQDFCHLDRLYGFRKKDPCTEKCEECYEVLYKHMYYQYIDGLNVLLSGDLCTKDISFILCQRAIQGRASRLYDVTDLARRILGYVTKYNNMLHNRDQLKNSAVILMSNYKDIDETPDIKTVKQCLQVKNICSLETGLSFTSLYRLLLTLRYMNVIKTASTSKSNKSPLVYSQPTQSDIVLLDSNAYVLTTNIVHILQPLSDEEWAKLKLKSSRCHTIHLVSSTDAYSLPSILKPNNCAEEDMLYDITCLFDDFKSLKSMTNLELRVEIQDLIRKCRCLSGPQAPSSQVMASIQLPHPLFYSNSVSQLYFYKKHLKRNIVTKSVLHRLSKALLYLKIYESKFSRSTSSQFH